VLHEFIDCRSVNLGNPLSFEADILRFLVRSSFPRGIASRLSRKYSRLNLKMGMLADDHERLGRGRTEKKARKAVFLKFFVFATEPGFAVLRWGLDTNHC